jgi:hypothetical protein
MVHGAGVVLVEDQWHAGCLRLGVPTMKVLATGSWTAKG